MAGSQKFGVGKIKCVIFLPQSYLYRLVCASDITVGSLTALPIVCYRLFDCPKGAITELKLRVERKVIGNQS